MNWSGEQDRRLIEDHLPLGCAQCDFCEGKVTPAVLNLARVIGPVARDLNDATRNLIQQGRQQTTVVDPGRCSRLAATASSSNQKVRRPLAISARL